MKASMRYWVLGVVLAVVVGVAPIDAHAILVTIDFESDPAGNKGLSYVSVDSPLVTFSDDSVSVQNFGGQSIGQGLATFGSNLGLNLDFSVAIDSLSMAFGNDDPGFAEDRAVLTAFSGLTQVGQTVLIYNKNDLADQTISISGIGAFDRAHLIYLDSSFNAVSALAEVVDNVTFNTTSVPVPATLALMAMGVAAVVVRRRH